MTRCRQYFPGLIGTLILILAVSTAGCQHAGTLVDPLAAIDGPAVQLVAGPDGQITHQDVQLNDLLLASDGKTIVVDFWATWCGPCRMLAPELEKVAQQRPDNVIVLKVDVDANPELAAHYQVHGIPDIRVFRDGKATRSVAGFHTAEEIIARIP
ncbi:MAG: thioredoxin [Fuerstiella sp.]